MEKSAKLVGQIYGYFICLTAIILFLTSVQSIVGSLVDLGNPKFTADLPGSNLESFEKYKMHVMNSLRAPGAKRRPEATGGSDPATDVESPPPPYVPDDTGLRTMFEAERTIRFDSARHAERRRIFENGLMGILSVGLFVVHWLWLRKRPRSATKTA